jgi:hypothetical protein
MKLMSKSTLRMKREFLYHFQSLNNGEKNILIMSKSTLKLKRKYRPPPSGFSLRELGRKRERGKAQEGVCLPTPTVTK